MVYGLGWLGPKDSSRLAILRTILRNDLATESYMEPFHLTLHTELRSTYSRHFLAFRSQHPHTQLMDGLAQNQERSNLVPRTRQRGERQQDPVFFVP